MNPKKHISPDAFIAPALAELEVDILDEALFRKFFHVNAGKLDELWGVFLEEEAYDYLMARTPSLRTLIRHTTLSTRTKNALEKNFMETVGQLRSTLHRRDPAFPRRRRRCPGGNHGVHGRYRVSFAESGIIIIFVTKG